MRIKTALLGFLLCATTAVGVAQAAVLAGDLNCDGVVNAFDIDPFVIALTQQSLYQQTYPHCDRLAADCNGDGYVDAFDIDPFVQHLIGARYFVADEHTVALWRLNGDGADASEAGADLSVDPSRVTWTAGRYSGGALMGEDTWSGDCFNSPGAALTAPGAICTYPGVGDWTVEAWVKYPDVETNRHFVSHYSEHWAGHDPYWIGLSAGQLIFQINNTEDVRVDASEYVGQWIHVAGVYRYQESLELWVNGQRVATTPTLQTIEYLPDYNVFVGGSFCGTGTGLLIDEVRISDVARYVEITPLTAAWTKDASNPVIQGGGGDSRYFRQRPTVIVEDDGPYAGQFRMWLEYNREIYHAASPNGLDWDISATAVVPKHTFAVQKPWVIKEDGVYKMWFTGNSGTGVHGGLWIEYATSADGLAWDKHGAVLTMGPDFDYWTCADPIVAKGDDGVYRMYYAASSASGQPVKLALADSSDGVSWTKHGVVFEGDGDGFDASDVFPGGVIYENGVFWLFYGARAIPNDNWYDMGIAWSTDGVSFSRQADPLIPRGAAGEWDQNGSAHGVSVLKLNGEYWMWYGGYNGTDYTVSIGAAKGR